MTTKRKSEIQSPVNYWWNEFLFVKHFVIETDMSPEEIVPRLKTLHRVPDDFWGRRPYNVVIETGKDDVIRFDICSQRYTRKGDSVVTTRADGVIVYDIGAGITTLHGQAKLNSAFYVEVLVVLLLFLGLYVFAETTGILPNPLALPWLWLLLLVAICWRWWQHFKSRNRLIDKIGAVLNTRKGKEK